MFTEGAMRHYDVNE